MDSSLDICAWLCLIHPPTRPYSIDVKTVHGRYLLHPLGHHPSAIILKAKLVLKTQEFIELKWCKKVANNPCHILIHKGCIRSLLPTLPMLTRPFESRWLGNFWTAMKKYSLWFWQQSMNLVSDKNSNISNTTLWRRLYSAFLSNLVHYLVYWSTKHVGTNSGEGIVALYAVPNPFLLNKICLNQLTPTHQTSEVE